MKNVGHSFGLAVWNPGKLLLPGLAFSGQRPKMALAFMALSLGTMYFLLKYFGVC